MNFDGKINNNQIPFRLRPNPLKLGPNFKGVNRKMVGEIERCLAANRKTLAAMDRNNFKLAPGGSVKEGLINDLAEYCTGYFKADIFKVIAKKIELNMGRQIAILDIASGLCVAARELQERLKDKARVYGMDIHKYDQMGARKDLPEIPFVEGVMESLPFAEDELFDVVLNNSLAVSCAIPHTLDETLRVLKPAGLAIFSLWKRDFGSQAFAYFLHIALSLPRSEHLKEKGAPRLITSGTNCLGFPTSDRLPFILIKLPGAKSGFFVNYAKKEDLPLF